LYGFLKNLRFFEPFLYLFFLEKGLNFLQIGTLITVREITRNILEIPTGIFADALGRRRTMIFAFIFYILSFLIFYMSAVYWLFIVAMLFFSFGDAFRTGTHKAMIFEYLKIKGWDNQKVFYYGHTRSWSQMGSAISSLMAAFIVFYSGSYRFIFLFSTIPYILDLGLMVTYPKELDGKIQLFEGTKMKDNFKKVMKEVVFSFRNVRLFKAISSISVFSGFYRAVKDYLQPVLNTFVLAMPVYFALTKEQTSALVIGMVYFFIYFLTSFASRISGKFSEKFKGLPGSLNLSLLLGLLFGVLTGIFYKQDISVISLLSIVIFICIYLVENMRRPIGIAYVAGLLNKDILATALSTESQVKGIYAALLAPLIGFLADTFGIGIALLLVSAFLVMLIPVFWLKSRTTPISA
jgi:MFS family permease